MACENSELIMALWARLKPHIPVKERLEVADVLVMVFDEFGLADDLTDVSLDRELRAAVRSHFGDSEVNEDDYDDL